jgi:hypothetical protein
MRSAPARPRQVSGLRCVSPLGSHIGFLEGESFAFPLPTLVSLGASPSRTPSCDQGGHPPWNPRCFASQTSNLAPLISSSQGSGCMLRSPYERRAGRDPRSGERGTNRARFPRRGNRSVTSRYISRAFRSVVDGLPHRKPSPCLVLPLKRAQAIAILPISAQIFLGWVTRARPLIYRPKWGKIKINEIYGPDETTSLLFPFAVRRSPRLDSPGGPRPGCVC